MMAYGSDMTQKELNGETATEAIPQPTWAERTEHYADADRWSHDPTAPVGEHVAAEYDRDFAGVRVEQMFRSDHSPVSALHVHADVYADELDPPQARDLAAALVAAAAVVERSQVQS